MCMCIYVYARMYKQLKNKSTSRQIFIYIYILIVYIHTCYPVPLLKPTSYLAQLPHLRTDTRSQDPGGVE